jgi:hypothetical protein
MSTRFMTGRSRALWYESDVTTLTQVFTPTMMLSFLFPLFSNPYTRISKLLTNYENHRTEQGYENALTQKIFLLTFFTGYMSIILTAFVYSNCPAFKILI